MKLSVPPLVSICLLLACGSDPAKPPEDVAAPAAVTDLSADEAPDGTSITLSWTAPGDDGADGRAVRYDVRYADEPITDAVWDSAAIVPTSRQPERAGTKEHLEVTSLAEGAWYFALKTADEVPNWSERSNWAGATLVDRVSPSTVTDLAVSDFDLSSVTLTWTAPGGNGTQGRAVEYDLRYLAGALTPASWDQATRATLGAPLVAGATETFTIEGLETGATYQFAIKAADARPNWSDISNLVQVRTGDFTAPSAITDLHACAPAPGSLVLTWTATGDDGDDGVAAMYDLRYSPEPITSENWDAATPASGLPAPGAPGMTESFTLTGVEERQTYHFAVRVVDDLANWSALSNGVETSGATAMLRRLTSLTAIFPAWSPDGQQIAFDSWKGPSPRGDIYRMAAGCGSPVQLTDTPAGETYPSWSPNGEKIAFCRDGHALWTMNADGSGAALLAQYDDEFVFETSWAPDGSEIAYTVYTDPDQRICRIASSGGTPVFWGAGAGAEWSPDGTKILYGSKDSGNEDIWVRPVVGGEALQLTNDPGRDGRARWSPDGSRIVFYSDRNGGAHLWMMSADGSNPVQLTSGPSIDSDAAWSPNSDEIVFRRTWPEKNPELWILTME